MSDIFEHTVICKNCNLKMKPVVISKNGFRFRALYCEKCEDKILHHKDVEEYNQFKNLRHKTFQVKLRLVGNSYAVSIPKEIVDFMQEQKQMMDNLVKLCFEDINRLSLMFDTKEKEDKEQEEHNKRKQIKFIR